MYPISLITFKGIDKPAAKTVDELRSAPTSRELGTDVLPIGDKSKAIKPSLPNDFINAADLKRYRKIQRKWAESLAQRLGIPIDNVLARLPGIQAGDVQQMIKTGLLGQFNTYKNTIEIIPVTELVNLYGGEDAKIVHESTHAYLHNLRLAWASKFTKNQLFQMAYNIIATKILEGESGLIPKGFISQASDGQQGSNIDFMRPPILTKEERGAVVNTINSFKEEYLDESSGKINDNGKKFIRETLLPQLTEYSKQFADVSLDNQDEMLEKMVNYIGAFFIRRNSLVASLLSSNSAGNKRNIQTALTEKEQYLAINSLVGLNSTQQGNALALSESDHILEDSQQPYFTAYEERLARHEENLYRQQNVKRKIAQLTHQGVTPSNALYEEQRIVENNLRLLDLTRKLLDIEKQIISAEKNPQKVAERNRLIEEINEIGGSECTRKFNIIVEYIQQHKELNDSIQSDEDLCRVIETYIPDELKMDPLEGIKMRNRQRELLQAFNILNSPVNLVADTPENLALKAEFDSVLQRIKEIASKCDLSSIPNNFFKTEADFLEANNIFIAHVEKWMKRLKL